MGWQIYDDDSDLYCCKDCGFINGMSGSRTVCDTCPAGPCNASEARDRSQKACGYRVTCIHPVCPDCNYKTIEIEADSLDMARNKVKSKIPNGFVKLSEEVLNDGKQKVVRKFSSKVEKAYTTAQKEIPPDAEILWKKELNLPRKQIVNIEAFDKSSAARLIKDRNEKMLGPLKMITLGKKGFFGIGKKPNQYEVEVFQPAIVEIAFKNKAKVFFTFKKK